MLCERCQKRPATVHVTKVVNHQKSEFHLCAECAGQQEELAFPAGLGDSPFSIPNLLGELLNYDTWFGGRSAPVKENARCRGCGITYREFTRSGLLGCSRCYDEFGPRLEPLLQRVHGSTQHVGKVPRRRGGVLHIKRQIEELKRGLNEAVVAERYEEAARLRDQIRELERQLEPRG